MDRYIYIYGMLVCGQGYIYIRDAWMWTGIYICKGCLDVTGIYIYIYI